MAIIIESKENNKDLVRLLEENGIHVLTSFKADDMLPYDQITFVRQITQSVDVVDCIRVHQLVANSGYKVYDCYIRIHIIDGLLENLSGEVSFSKA